MNDVRVQILVRPVDRPEFVLDSGHFAVRNLRAAITKRKGQIMSAAVMEPVLVLDTADRMGTLVVLKNEAASLASRAGGHIAAGYHWVAETLHLSAAGGFFRGVWDWVKSKAMGVAALLGTSGMVGAGMLAVGTNVGRKAISVVTSPFRWIASKIVDGYIRLEEALIGERTEGVRFRIGTMMGNLRERAEDIIGQVKGSRVAAVLRDASDLDSAEMGFARTAGTALVMTGAAPFVAAHVGATAAAVVSFVGTGLLFYAGLMLAKEIGFRFVSVFAQPAKDLIEEAQVTSEMRNAEQEARRASEVVVTADVTAPRPTVPSSRQAKRQQARANA